MKQLAPPPFRHLRGRRRGDEVDEDVDEPRRRLAVRVVADVLEDLEPAAGDGLVGRAWRGAPE